MFKMLLGSNATFLCCNLPYNMNISEISKKSQPNLSLVMLIFMMLMKQTKKMCMPNETANQEDQTTHIFTLRVEVREWKITKNCP